MKLHHFAGAASFAAALAAGPAFASPECFENDCDVRIVYPTDGASISASIPKFYGFATPHAQVEIFANFERSAVTADAEGRWVWVPASPLADGRQRITARADGKSSEITLEIDTVPPTVAILSPAADTTRTALNLVARGQIEPGAHLEVTLDGEPIEVRVEADGTWFHVGAREIIDGAHSLSAVARDKAGNASLSQVGFQVDRRAPSVHISSPHDGFIAEAPSVITGFAEPGSTVKVMGPGFETELTVPASGRWFQPLSALADGAHHFRVVATDAAGWSAQDEVSIMLDTVPPELAVRQSFDHPTTETLLRLSGSAEPNSRVTVETELGEIGMDRVSATGRWEIVAYEPLPDGLHGVVITATDRAGNQTWMMTSVLVDTIAPLVELTEVFDAGDKVTLSGFAEPRAHIDVSVQGEVGAMTLAGHDGRWTAEVTVPKGAVELEIVAIDAAGNASSIKHELSRDDGLASNGCGGGQAPALMMSLIAFAGFVLRRQRA